MSYSPTDVLDLLLHQVQKCRKCGGSGVIEKNNTLVNCRFCRGHGEILDATPFIPHIRQALKKDLK